MRLCENCHQGEPRCECGDQFRPSSEFSLWDPTTEEPTQEMIDTAPPGMINTMTDLAWMVRANLLDKVVPETTES